MALSAKVSGDPYRVYAMLGDGESEEGQVWEAAMFAAHYKLDNLVAVLDWNGLQIDGPIAEVMNPTPHDEKFSAFGWHVISIDAHDFDAIEAAFAEARTVSGKPTVIIAKSLKGKGVSYMENKCEWHGQAPKEDLYKVAIADLEKIAEVVKKHQIWCLSDEIYCELLYDNRKHVSIGQFDGMKDYAIIFNGFSKSFAMTGWRIGYIAAPNDLLTQCCKLHAYNSICPPIFSQYAAAEALRHAWDEVEKMRVSYQQRRNLMHKAFIEMGLPCTEPEGAFYMFPDIRPTGMTSEEFATELIQNYNVAVVPGTCFGDGGEGFIRCCYATDINKLKIAMERIAEMVSKKIKK
jgi:hypothetical protein